MTWEQLTKKVKVREGPGTELKRLLMKFRIQPSGTCLCLHLATKMNDYGIPWCWSNLNFLSAELEQEAHRRGRNFPLLRLSAKVLITLALIKSYATTH